MRWWPLVTCVLVVCAVQAAGCPSVCSCKWKGGKQTVECMDHGLITIPETIDSETQVLDMSNNNLQILPRDNFVRANLLNLQKVYFRNCRLGQIDNNAFRGLTNLVELDLSNNLLTNIPSATFQDVPLLRDLVLSNNPIQKIESHAFQFLTGMVKLDLSGCELKSIAPKAFDELEQLESLKLNNNILTELRQKTVDTLRRLHGVELHNNPWMCDCRLRPVKSWLQENNIPYSVEPVCGGPERLSGRSFGELHLDDFACKPEVLPVSRHIEAVSGDDASIVCRVLAVPPATISWFWNGRLLQNNSALAAAQRVIVFEDGTSEKSSSLVLINAQENDAASGDFYCVAENRAGTAEANFTLHVAVRQAGMASLGSGQIAGLSAALVVLILFVLLLIILLLVRIRRMPFASGTKSQTPHDAPPGKAAAAASAATVAIETERRGNGSIMMSDPALKSPVICEIKLHSSGPKHSLTDVRALGHHPQLSTQPCGGLDSFRNPDLLNEAERADVPPRCGLSGEYSRAHGDSLYPSGLWDAAADLYLPADATDKTPIIEDAPSGMGGGQHSPWDPSDYPSDYGLPIPSHSPPPAPAPTSSAPPPLGAKTLRVWQRGAAPVLPPVTALKRVLGSRNSPDEGYQEGCGTDV